MHIFHLNKCTITRGVHYTRIYYFQPYRLQQIAANHQGLVRPPLQVHVAHAAARKANTHLRTKVAYF